MTQFDWLDLHVAFAVCADELGLGHEGDQALCSLNQQGPSDLHYYRLSFDGCQALYKAGDLNQDCSSWVELIAIPLVEELCDRLGGEWRSEAVVAVEMVLAERVDRLQEIAKIGQAGPVGFQLSREPVELVEERVLSPELIELV